MRSRYTAYTLGNEDYLLSTWHPSTRPESVLTGYFERVEKPVDMKGVMREINDTLKEEEARQLYRASMTR